MDIHYSENIVPEKMPVLTMGIDVISQIKVQLTHNYVNVVRVDTKFRINTI